MRVQGYQIGNIRVLSRTSSGGITLASDAPRSGTWRWAVFVERQSWPPRLVSLAQTRTGQWHDYYWLPFGYRLCVSRQDYHKQPAASPFR